MSALIGESEGPRLNAGRWRASHGPAWEQLDDCCRRLERKGVRALSEDELLALPQLYRAALSSLSAAREFSLDVALTAWLEQLCARAYFQIYGVPASGLAQLAGFFAHGWPNAVRSLWRELAFCIALTLLAALAGWWLVRSDPSWFYALVPGGMSEGREPGAAVTLLRDTIHGGKPGDPLALFATALFTHNAQVALMAVALGFAFAVPSVLLIAYQGLMMGAMIAVFSGAGLGGDFIAWLTIHGTTELLAINIAGAAGLRIGRAAAFPGSTARLAAISGAGRQAAVAMGGVVVMLMVAGLLEGVGRQLVQDSGARVAIGLAMLCGWAIYFSGGKRDGHAR